jgi:THO complex subunit 2
MTALLLQSDFISLDQLYSHLSPSDGIIEEQDGNAMKEAQEKAKKMGSTVLSERAAESQEGQEPMDTDDIKTDVPNQKFMLCEALLRVGDWTHAKAMIDRLPPYVVTSYPPVSRALSGMLHMTLELFYRQHAPVAARGRVYPALSNSTNHGVPQLTSFTELPLHVLPILFCLGPYIAVDPLLFAKVEIMCLCVCLLMQDGLTS